MRLGGHDRRLFGTDSSKINLPFKVDASGALIISGVSASGVSINDSNNNFSGANVEVALAELGQVKEFWNGTFDESFNFLVTSAGGVVSGVLTAADGGNLTLNFSDGKTSLDVPLEIALTAGSDASPTENFIFIPQSTKVLTKSTSGWSSVEHTKVGFSFVPSATFVENNGSYVNQNWNDDKFGSDKMGDSPHIGERLRRLGAQYFSGVAGNGTTSYLTIITNAGSADNVFFKSTAGIVYQKHSHTVSAVDTSVSDKLLVINQHTNNGGAFDDITDLNVLLKDANDVSMSGKYFNLVFVGVANKTGEFSPFCVNLPTGSYNRQSDAENSVIAPEIKWKAVPLIVAPLIVPRELTPSKVG